MDHRSEIRSLTGLRGIAALWIVIYHFHHRDVEGATWYWQYLERGYLAVDIFFVLSGYVMALSYGHLFANGFHLSDYGAFMLRRVARVYPLYLLVVLLVIAGSCTPFESLWGRGYLSWWEYVANILMIQTWGIGPSVVGPSWSLSTELAAYVLFPLLVTLVLRSTKTFALATVAVGYLLLALAVLYTSGSLAKDAGSLDVTTPYSGFPILRCLVQFCGGLLAYRISITPRLKNVLARPATSYLAVGVALGLIAFPGTDLAVAATFPWIVAGLAVSRRGVSSLLSATGPFFLGEISYSLYMLHIEFLRLRRLGYRVLNDFLDPAIAVPLVLVAVYLALFVTARWTYVHVETKARRMIQNLASRRVRVAVQRSEDAGQADLLR